eukprot:jgi/Bigna1/78878/fgenesh1_pg.58_\
METAQPILGSDTSTMKAFEIGELKSTEDLLTCMGLENLCSNEKRMVLQGKRNPFDYDIEIPQNVENGTIKKLNLTPEDIKNWGNSLFREGNCETAAEKYLMGIELANEKFRPPLALPLELLSILHCNLGTCFLRLHKPDEALREIEESLKFNPNYWRAHWRKGQIFELKQKNNFLAMKQFKKAVQCKDIPSKIKEKLEAVTDTTDKEQSL